MSIEDQDMRSAKGQHQALAFAVLWCAAFWGCGDSWSTSNEPAETLSASIQSERQPNAGASVEAFANRAAETDMVAVQSRELNGIWLGAADDLAVVIRFIGRASRQPGRPGTVEGEWFVELPGHTIGSGLQFIDDETAGVIELEVGLWNARTEETWRASLGRVERGVSGRLYLSIYENEAHPAYRAVNRMSLKHISDHPRIRQNDVDLMIAAWKHGEVAEQ